MQQHVCCWCFASCFMVNIQITWSKSVISRDIPKVEVHTRTRKEVESKHHGIVKELTSEHQRFNRTEILSSLRKNGGYTCDIGLDFGEIIFSRVHFSEAIVFLVDPYY